MTDIKEAHGLEVFTVPGRYLAVNRKNPGAQDVVLLSGATAVIDQQAAELAYFGEQELHLRSVIDQLREQVEYTEGMYATALEIVNELRADLETANSMLVATSKAGIQLREQVAELDEKVIQLEDRHARNLDWRGHCVELQAELDALKSAPVGMPDDKAIEQVMADVCEENKEFEIRVPYYALCVHEFKEVLARLNRSKTNEQ